MEKQPRFNQILVIQTAFIGDVILATGLLEKLHQHFPEAHIDFLVRKGNESLLKDHPFLRKTLVWNKQGGKYRNLFKLITEVRSNGYDLLVNVQRFANSGMITAFSKAKMKIGFDKNPMAWAFDKKTSHHIEEGVHEISRNHALIKDFTDELPHKPKLYPSPQDYEATYTLQTEPYLCMAPASVWFTKQFPKEQWINLVKSIPFEGKIYLLGAPSDKSLCDEIIEKAGRKGVENTCGKLSLLQSAALMEKAEMNYVNDSAPMHLASAVNAKTCAIFCSTVPDFGFGPLSDQHHIVQVKEDLSCRPCGLHGKKACPEGHFKCGHNITMDQLTTVLD